MQVFLTKMNIPNSLKQTKQTKHICMVTVLQMLDHNHVLNHSTHSRKGRLYACSRCVEQGDSICSHCFICREEGHRTVGCCNRTKSKERTYQTIKTQQPTSRRHHDEARSVDSRAQVVSVNGEARLHTPREANSGQNKVAELVGSKCLMNCYINGYSVTV